MEYEGTHAYIHSMSLSKRLSRTASVLPRFDRLVIKDAAAGERKHGS